MTYEDYPTEVHDMSVLRSFNTGVNVYNAVRIAQMNAQMATIAKQDRDRQAFLQNAEKLRQSLFEFKRLLEDANNSLQSNPLNSLCVAESSLFSLESYDEQCLPELQDKEYLHRVRDFAKGVRDTAYHQQSQDISDCVRRYAFLQYVKPKVADYLIWTRIISLIRANSILFFPTRLGAVHFFSWFGIVAVAGFFVDGISLLAIPTPLFLGYLRRRVTKKCNEIAAATGGYVTKYIHLKGAQDLREQVGMPLRSHGFNMDSKSVGDIENDLRGIEAEISELDARIQPYLP